MSTDDILQLIGKTPLPGFFVTVDFTRASGEAPQWIGIEAFLKEKHSAIRQGVSARKFSYQEAGWRMIFTFFPTDSVVEEKYAMKNKRSKNQRTF